MVLLHSAMFHLKEASGRRDNEEWAPAGQLELESEGGGHDVVARACAIDDGPVLVLVQVDSDKICAAFWRSLLPYLYLSCTDGPVPD